MDIREEIRLSKEDKLPESSGLPHSGQQRSYLIEMSILWRVRFISVLGKLGKIELAKKVVDISLNQGIYAKVNRWEICVAIADGQFKQLLGAHEGIVSGRGSTVASRASKVTGRGSSRKWITSDMAIAAKASRQVLNPKPVSEFNPTVGHVVPIKDKESDVVKVKNPADVVYKSRNQKRPLKKPAAVVEKPDAVVEKPDAVLDKKSAPAKKPTSVVVQDKDSVVVNYPAELDQEKDKEKHKASAKEPVSIVDRVCEVAKHIMFHVEDALKNVPLKKRQMTMTSTEFDQLQALFQKKKLNVVSKDKPKSTVEKASDVVSDKPVVKKSVNAPVVAAVESVVEKDNPKVMSKVSDKPSSVVCKDKDKAKNNGSQGCQSNKENPNLKLRTTLLPFFSAIRNSRVDILGFLTDIGFSSLYNVSIDHLPLKLGWFAVSNFKNYMLSFDSGDKIELLYLDSTKFDKFLVVRTRPAIRNWSSYLMKQRQELELKDHVLGLLDLHDDWNEAEVQESEGFIGFSKTSEKEALFKRAEEKLAAICSERYVQVFRDPISFDVDMDVVNESNGDDDNDNDGDGNGDEEDANDGDENGSNPSFGFSKISLDDFGNDIGPTEKESVDPVDPAEQEIVVEGDPAEECQIMSHETITNGLEKNLDLVGEGDLFGDNSATRELMNKGPVTSERMPTPKASPIAKKRVVKPSPYMLSPYMNKKTNVVPKITRSEFILGNSVFAMQGDKIESVFETHSGEYSVYGLRLNMETLAPGLWIDANVIDCWGAILNHEERFRVADSKSRHFFPTGCITKSMFDGTLATDEAKWDSFSNQVKSQFGGNVDGLALQGIDLPYWKNVNDYPG
ncbi:hypothetical protein Tco_1044947 [Tanacetum coccineum]|uniref:Uncharacterized protein n=1 Tax=Tanacetum coccineum TaxID=301880 RepID=A0ABQ5GTA7_9ASTR